MRVSKVPVCVVVGKSHERDFVTNLLRRRTNQRSFDDNAMAEFIVNKIFWLFCDSKDTINIKKNVLVIVSAIWFCCRAKPYTRISSTGIETHFLHGRAYVAPIVSTSTISTIEGTNNKGSTTNVLKTKRCATYDEVFLRTGAL